MGVYIFNFLMGLLPVLWIISIVLLRKWKHIIRYIISNTILVLIYFLALFYSKITFFEHDEYGLKKVFLFLMIIGAHTIIGFIFALYYKYKMSKITT